MITAVAVCPSPPLLLPEYTGRQDAAAMVRRWCGEVVRPLAAADRVVLVSAADREPRHAEPPLGQRVGRHLLAEAGVDRPVEPLAVAWDAEPAHAVRIGASLATVGPTTGLLVMADGSARRGEKAPGHLDERAFAVDEVIVAGLREADPGMLAGLDAQVCDDLLIQGRVPLQVLAGVLGAGGRYATRSLHVADPFGVLYVVAALDLI